MEDSVSVLEFARCRAQEIMNLMTDVVTKEPKLALQKLPYHMRRRAASHNPKRLPRSLRLKKVEETAKSSAKSKKKHKCHKNRLEEYNSRQTDSSWLPTHIWFAKRFHMKKMWGYHLPFQATGKRFRSSYRATIKNALVQDLSYFCCIELRGEEKYLLLQLSALSDESLGMNFASESYIDGTKEGNCILYHPHTFPRNAIGPVSFIWNSCCSISGNETKYNHSSSRQLWIWCHPTIHEELLQVLISLFHLKEGQISEVPKKEFKFASNVNYVKTKLHFQKEPVFSSSDVTMVILKNTLVRHRLIGPNALPILTSVLNIEDSESTSSGEHGNHSDLSTDMEIGDEEVQTCSKISENVTKTDDSKLLLAKLKVWNYLCETKSSYSVPIKSIIGLTIDDPRLYVTPRYSSYKKNVDDSESEEREHLPLLDECNSPETAASELWNQEIRDKVTASQVPEHVLNSKRAKYVIPHATDLRKYTTKVPVMVIHQPAVNGYGSGWDIIAPQGWGMAFWIPFIYHGAQPAGLDDYCSINLESGCPTFPSSFPDTKAGAAYEEDTRETHLKNFYKYSRAKRPNFRLLGVAAPFFMPWNVLVNDWESEFLNKYPRKAFNSSNIEPLFAVSNLNCDKDDSFFTLRSKAQIMHMKHLCVLLERYGKCPSSEEILSLRNALSLLIQTLLKPQNIYLKCIIPVRVKCLFRGIPSKFSGIYLPNESDMQNLKESHYFGPIESQHSENGDHLNIPAKKKRKILKEEAKLDSKKLHRPAVEAIVSCCDRKLIGYISEGSYSRLNSHGCGVGHCTLTGLLSVLELCTSCQMSVTVLVREQHNFQYRPARIDIIEDYN